MIPTTTTNPYILVALKGSQRDATPSDIIQAVCEVTGIPTDTIMMRKNRTKNVVTARFLAWKIIKDKGLLGLSGIGDYFGGFDHTSVLHGVKAVNGWMESDKNVAVLHHDVLDRLMRITIR